jgi:hypothetical protein
MSLSGAFYWCFFVAVNAAFYSVAVTNYNYKRLAVFFPGWPVIQVDSLGVNLLYVVECTLIWQNRVEHLSQGQGRR